MEQKQHGKITTEESADSSKSSDDEFFFCAMRRLKQVKKQVDNAPIENDPDQDWRLQTKEESQTVRIGHRRSSGMLKPTQVLWKSQLEKNNRLKVR